MAVVVEAYDSFETPTIFDASISVDDQQIDSYFAEKMDVDKAECFDPENWSVFPQIQDTEEPHSFNVEGADFTFNQMTTPPPSATEQPADWAQQSKPEPAYFSNTLHQIDTSQGSNTHFSWGQPTPPDDEGSPASFPAAAEESIKQEPGTEQSKPSPRRKKSEDKGDTATKRRRSRKSMSAGTINDESPVDPAEEERRNRFLERNRVAASKCRQKKKEWTQNLETHARELHANNHQLQVLMGSLKDEVMYLRGEMLKHNTCECTGIRDYLSREADFLASGAPRSPASHMSAIHSRHTSTVSSPRNSIDGAADASQNILDPQLHNQLEGSLKRKLASERTANSSNETSAKT